MPHAALGPTGPLPADDQFQPAVQDFMHDLRALRTESGAPSYAVLSARSGLPRSTVYDALRRDRLPALETALALVEAFGADRTEWRRRWTEARAAADAGGPQLSGRTAPDGIGQPSGRSWRPGRRWQLAVVAFAVVVVAGAVLALAPWPQGSSCHRAQLYTVTSAGDLLNAAGQTVARTQAGDTIEVGSHKHDAFAHRLQGTVERTGDIGYIDEARIDPARSVCR